jgi:hypothetical protein
MCIWAKYIVIVEHKANSAWDTIRHDVKSLLGIHLELGENVKISNIQKIVNKTTLILKKTLLQLKSGCFDFRNKLKYVINFKR